MHEFTNHHISLLAAKEWLPQTDGATATPYFVKLVQTNDQMVFLSTDTKSVWAEVIPCRTLMRRWCGQNSYKIVEDASNTLISEISDITSTTHSLSGWSTCFSFQPVESVYSEKAFVLKFRIADSHYQWTWETDYVGSRLSADIISKQLLLPLLSTAHIGFSSSLPGMSQPDVQQAVDKVGRVIKRSLDIHVKNALSKPRLVTVIQRLSATLGHSSDLPPVLDDLQTPSFRVPTRADTPENRGPSRLPSPVRTRPQSPTPPVKDSPKEVPPSPKKKSPSPSIPPKDVSDNASATESESDSPAARRPLRKYAERQASSQDVEAASAIGDSSVVASPLIRRKPPPRRASQQDDEDESKDISSTQKTESQPAISQSPPPQRKKLVRRKADSEDEDKDETSLSPVPPPRKTLKRRTTESGSESESNAAGPQLKRTPAPRGGGTRQPIKRGGKKF